jgi:hypothetical protein
MNITLSKALKIKNRIAKEVKDLQTIIAQNNSYVTGNNPSFNVEDSYKELIVLRKKLGELKIKINSANAGMIEKMVEINELKSHITFLRTIDTKEGQVPASRYGDGNMIDKSVTFNAKQIKDKEKETQKKIDAIQDEIDRFNANTTIEFAHEA